MDPKTLAWVPWALYLAWLAGTSTLAVCDSLGERLAWWLGITSPKYYYEIQEAKRMKREEEERLSRQDAEMAGWEKKQKEEGEVVSSQEMATAKVREEPLEKFDSLVYLSWQCSPEVSSSRGGAPRDIRQSAMLPHL